MDLNTALMESMFATNMLSNTRTPFTDMSESNPSGPLGANNSLTAPNNSLNHNHHSNNNMNHLHSNPNSNATNNHSSPLIQHQLGSLEQQFSNNNHLTQNIHNSNNNTNNNIKTTLIGGHNNSIHQHHNANNHHSNQHMNFNNNNNNNNNISSQQHNLISPSHPCQHQPHHNSNSNHYHNHSYASNNIQPSTNRISQPIRTQIPIHCYIEQLDACADLTGYGSASDDAELFTTINPDPIVSKPTPHLNQSKLALESITNTCNGSSTSLPSIPNTTSNSIFNHNDNNNDDNNDLDALDDANLDQLNRCSPLSIQTNRTNTSNLNLSSTDLCQGDVLNSGLSNKLVSTSCSFDSNHSFQSCRETYAIVTSNVLYIDLLRTVLIQLGYCPMDLINAKATIQIKNWKPLALDQVTDDKSTTVGEVLGDISTFVTLRIRIYSSVTQLPTEWNETMIRQVVLALTQTMSQLTLSKLCNISQPLISSIVRGGKKLGRRKCAEFGQWYMNYIKTAEARPSQMFCEGGGSRLVFDKTREIPQLKSWFAIDNKPTDEMLEEYSKILNEHVSRKDSRPQVSAKALRNWWKNERQKRGIRQREMRGRPKLKRIEN